MLPPLSQSKYQAGFRVIFWGKNPYRISSNACIMILPKPTFVSHFLLHQSLGSNLQYEHNGIMARFGESIASKGAIHTTHVTHPFYSVLHL